ncbi:MAG: SDR family oxidoreductase [Bryobacteraceae bacterium]|nr:SDR family oxidoreductase [Bryobacteraceae bacterium]
MISTGLSGKVVVVTGAAAGIGRAAAVRFLAEGCRVIGWDIAPGGPEGVEMSRVNVADPAQVNAAAARIESVDVLVNNAGILRDGQLARFKDGEFSLMPDEAFNAVIDVNLKGVFHCARAIAPKMIAAGRGGVILNASSVVSLYGNFGQTNYIAAKAGVIGMTRVWARELGKYGIRVNAVAPGFVSTDILRDMPEKVLESMRQRTPLGRLGTPEEIAEAYLWLASSSASFITGAVLSVDGGVVTGT